MGMNGESERRKHPRVSRNFFMRVKDKATQDPRWELPMMRNLSLGGCFFHSAVVFEEGQCLEIEIQLPVLKEPLRCTGLVRRVESRRGGTMAYVGVGLEFVNLDDEIKEKLKEIIDFVLSRQQNENR